MTQATALYELYKHLPERERHKFRGLLVGEIEDVSVLDKPRPQRKKLNAFKADGTGFKFDREASNER